MTYSELCKRAAGELDINKQPKQRDVVVEATKSMNKALRGVVPDIFGFKKENKQPIT